MSTHFSAPATAAVFPTEFLVLPEGCIPENEHADKFGIVVKRRTATEWTATFALHLQTALLPDGDIVSVTHLPDTNRPDWWDTADEAIAAASAAVNTITFNGSLFKGMDR